MIRQRHLDRPLVGTLTVRLSDSTSVQRREAFFSAATSAPKLGF